jgi:hypothetical protein
MDTEAVMCSRSGIQKIREPIPESVSGIVLSSKEYRSETHMARIIVVGCCCTRVRTRER